jgi:uncharacterized membrane protein
MSVLVIITLLSLASLSQIHVLCDNILQLHVKHGVLCETTKSYYT